MEAALYYFMGSRSVHEARRAEIRAKMNEAADKQGFTADSTFTTEGMRPI